MIKKIDKGYSFEIGNRIGGYLTQLFGLFLVISGVISIVVLTNFYSIFTFLFGFLLFTIGSTLSYGREYLIIDYKSKTVRNKLNILGFEFKKKEKDLSIYANISIISRRYTFDDSYDDNTESYYKTEVDYTYKHDLVFLTPKHLGRLLISQFDDYDEALELGKVVSKYTGKPLVKYAPQRISKKR